MNDVQNIYNRLLAISDSVINEFKILSNLSYMERENTTQFRAHVSSLSQLLDKEKVILFNLKKADFQSLCEYLIAHEDVSLAYARTLNLIADFLVAMDDEVDNEKETSDDFSEEIINSDDEADVSDIINSYCTDEDSPTVYNNYVVNCFATRVIKNMYNRILNTVADNPTDQAYKEHMLKYFNQFKYYYFMLNNQLELIGINYNFDLSKIPTPTCSIKDIEEICYNECLIILECLYISDVDFSMDSVETNLFNMMLFEEYIQNISDDAVLKLIRLCNEVSEKNNTFYGEIAKVKLIKRRQKD